MSVPDELKIALQRYDQAIEEGALSEAQINELFEEANQLVPNAMLSDIVFYSERSPDEIVEEALYREELWERGGDRAVLLHVRAQTQAVMDNPNASVTEKSCAERLLPGIERKLQELAGNLN